VVFDHLEKYEFVNVVRMTSHILWENNPAMFETPEVVDHPKNLATEGPKRKSLELSTRSVFLYL